MPRHYPWHSHDADRGPHQPALGRRSVALSRSSRSCPHGQARGAIGAPGAARGGRDQSGHLQGPAPLRSRASNSGSPWRTSVRTSSTTAPRQSRRRRNRRGGRRLPRNRLWTTPRSKSVPKRGAQQENNMFNNIEPLIDRWIDDNGFRATLQRDPEAALRAAGVSLTHDEQAALRAIDWSQSDGELTARISKCWG